MSCMPLVSFYMFDNLSDKLQSVIKELSRRGKLSEADVDSALREIRLALLEADVHFTVVKQFLVRVRERAVGQEVSGALNPGQQVLKIVHEELAVTLGKSDELDLKGQTPRKVMLVGLQGSGKTTMAAKLARLLRTKSHNPLLVAADTYRPAAIDQLQMLGAQIDVPVFSTSGSPPVICSDALEHAASVGHNLVIFDTAGRLQIDDKMMLELEVIRDRTQPNEVLLVADAMTGQEALSIAQGFHDRIGLTGLILTKMDGDARGGAAISMRTVTGVPIRYLGTSEKLDGVESFDPVRLAKRILGMGDVIGLIERAEAISDQKQLDKLETKLRKAEFDLEDFLHQMTQIRRMGPTGELLNMLPGMGNTVPKLSPQDVDMQLSRTEAIIRSMTPYERQNPRMMNASRKRRVASGSGTQVQEVNRLLKQFRQIHKMMKGIGKVEKGQGRHRSSMLKSFGL